MDKVRAYIEKNYSRMYSTIKEKVDVNKLIIEEHDHFYTVKSTKDESPLILSKAVGE